jgi:PPM family protein phosphatase
MMPQAPTARCDPQSWSEVTLVDAIVTETEAGRLAVVTRAAPSRAGPNEDSIALAPLDGSAVIIAVADGVGGAPLGSTASRLAVEAITQSVLQGDASSSVRERILEGFDRANTAVLGLGVGAATTLVVVEATPSWLRCYHTGDSAVLVTGQRGKLKLLTIAHSPVGYAVESGLLDEREAMNHYQRNVVSNLVGAADMRVEVGSQLALGPRDTVVVGTDGLFDNLHVPEIIQMARHGPLRSAALELTNLCVERMATPSIEHPSKPDDLSFVLFRPARMASRRSRAGPRRG